MPSRTVGLEAPLWRAIAVFRVATLVYAGILVGRDFQGFRHPLGGWLVLAVMTLWTGYAVWAYAGLRWRPTVLLADLVVTTGCLLSTGVVKWPWGLSHNTPNLTVSWVASVVMAWGLAWGRVRGAVAAAVLGVADVAMHAGSRNQTTYNGVVLLLLTGVVAGYVGGLARDAEVRLARAVELDAATRERVRLARRIHDSVLQVLALVQRRGQEIGGEAEQLGRLAGEQEAALRALIGTAPDDEPSEPGERSAPDGRSGPGGRARTLRRDAALDAEASDLRELLAPYASALVTISAPATAVRLAGAGEVAAAVGAALDNVRRHCGESAKAWILVEEDGGDVVVSIRDDGPGIEPGRLDEAASDGRLGVAQSIRGRVRDLGGTTTITSAPGAGTELELRVPRT